MDAVVRGRGQLTRRRLALRGRVQGVGFRPFVYRIATEEGLSGHVGNDPAGAFIEVEGTAEAVAHFTERLRTELPPLAQIAEMTAEDLALVGETEFRIEASRQEGAQKAEIAPDSATCPDCLREMSDSGDRRYGYPFINCTNCGPRYSIVLGVPYDRATTTMAVFPMCGACRAEYHDPANRRFHAQPNACPECGPHVWLADHKGRPAEGDAITTAAAWLKEGRILAVKGLGGFHLACRADRDDVVAELRRRKDREAKPLAMMAADLESARRIVRADDAAIRALTSVARPIVLAPKQPHADISRHVAPGTECYGVMLPYTPLHSLLFSQGLPPLVMTSGNPSAEPLCRDNDEALARLARIADGFLLHNRDIARRVDDSVVISIPLADGETVVMPLRRARGYAPAPIRTPLRAPRPTLAVGGELKSTVCLMVEDQAVVSEHLGDLDHPAAYRNFVETVECLERLLDVKPAVVACDLHPGYAATRYARSLGLPLVPVQHHHAHIVSCMSENGLTGRVIGLSCDGTGYGTDAAVWGCEILAADERSFMRAGHLKPFPLPGGDASAKDTWRPAVALLAETFGESWPAAAIEAAERIPDESLDLLRARLAAPSARIPMTSSLGRLFDAAAFLLGLCDRNRFEAEAPMALEAAAAERAAAEPLRYAVDEVGPLVCPDFRPLIRSLLEGREAGRSAGELARAFHDAVALMLAGAVSRVAARTGIRRVALSGGCFANRLLASKLWTLLREQGFDIAIHRRLPCGDGGVSLGQAVIAAAQDQS